MLAPSPSLPSVAELRARIAATAVSTRPGLPFGITDLDRHLAGGGLATDGVHEIAGASPGLSDDAAATLFVAGLAARFASKRDDGQVLWALTRFDLYAPGLEQAGLPANMLLFAQGRDDAEVLALAEDGLREGALAVVVAEVKRANMVATRRLQLAASEGGVPVVILRRWRRAASCPLSEPSAAVTRWRIGSVPSARLGLPGVGRAGWQVELVRQRGGEPFSLLLEACDGEGRLALPAAPRDRAAAQERAVARAA
ncbi:MULTISPECIES: protein ImuA [unclassified Sphingomonas]|uniref:ImuA family protein n=1 Tax=unclassified Sphingomonas TaxID=196159 RepID=UPI002269F0C3|nr:MULTISPECIES: protein ImuA [unclassified Sphingomonas]